MQISVEKATAMAKRRGEYPGDEQAFRDSLYKKDTNLSYGIGIIGDLMSPYQDK